MCFSLCVFHSEEVHVFGCLLESYGGRAATDYPERNIWGGTPFRARRFVAEEAFSPHWISCISHSSLEENLVLD